MTRRSDIRKAELKVLAIARSLVHTERAMHPHGTQPLWMLGEAIDELDALGLADPAAPRANACAPVTAQQAAEWMSDRASTISARIVRLLWNGGWQMGLTTEQIESALAGKHQTVSARVNELRDAGWIVDTGGRLLTSSKRNAIVWRLSHAAVEAVKGQEGLDV